MKKSKKIKKEVKISDKQLLKAYKKIDPKLAEQLRPLLKYLH